MEENEARIENNVANSTGSNEEITEPHVKQVVSAFDGRKFYREDIDKFKQLESVFRKIATLEDGESILKNLTKDITETVISGASLQINSGTVSVGQVATIILDRSEETYKINLELEETRAANRAAEEQPQQSEEKTTQIAGKDAASRNFDNKEEFDKFVNDFMSFFEEFGIKLNEEDKQIVKEELEEARQRAGMRDKDGNPKHKDDAEMMQKLANARTREQFLEATEDAIKKYQKKIDIMNGLIKKIEAKSDGKVKKEQELEIINLKEKLGRYTKVLKYFEACRDKILKDPNCKPEEVFGSNAESMEEYVDTAKRIEQLEREGKTKTKEYQNLSARRSFLLTYQETREIDEKIQSIREVIERSEKELETCTDKEKAELIKRFIKTQTGKLCIQISRKEKLQSRLKQMDSSYEMKDFDDEERPRPKFKLNKDGKSMSRTDIALDYAQTLNSKYIDEDGATGFLERQMAFIGKTGGLLDEKNVSQMAVESLLTRYDRIYERLSEQLYVTHSEEEKLKIVKNMYIAKDILKRALAELNISPQYQADILCQYSSAADRVNPEELHLFYWKISYERSVEKGEPNEAMLRIHDRLKNNSQVFNEIIEEMAIDPEKTALVEELSEALLKVSESKKMPLRALKKVTNENESIQALLEVYDDKFSDNPKFSPDVKKHFEDILRKVYSTRGTDGLLTIFENRSVMGDYLKVLSRNVRSTNVISDYYLDLKDDEKITIGEDSIDGKNGENSLPSFINPNSKKYVEIMLALRRDNLSEEQITSTLIQIEDNAARDAYALYELLLNKKALEDPQLGEDKKAELRSRNKELINMMYKAYKSKTEKYASRFEHRAEKETNPDEKNEDLKRAAEYKDMIEKAEEELQTFDIEKLSIKMPDESKLNEEHKRREIQARRVDKVKDNPPKFKAVLERYSALARYKTVVDENGNKVIKREKVSIKEISKKLLLFPQKIKRRLVNNKQDKSAQEESIKIGNVKKATENTRISDVNSQTRTAKEIGTVEERSTREEGVEKPDITEDQAL